MTDAILAKHLHRYITTNQDLWGIPAYVNKIFELFTNHSLSNSILSILVNLFDTILHPRQGLVVILIEILSLFLAWPKMESENYGWSAERIKSKPTVVS